MALNPSTAFTTNNDLQYKTPMYVVAFQTMDGYARRYRVSNIGYDPSSFPIYVDCEEYDADTDTWNDPNWNVTLGVGEWVNYTVEITSASGTISTRLISASSHNRLEWLLSIKNGELAIGDEVRIDKYESFCTYKPTTSAFYLDPKPYISYISGGGYSITPDEGSASSATLKIELQDKNLEVTNMIHNATGRLQKKTCIVKAGYIGMNETEMLTIFTGEVTSYQREKDGSWSISVSDAIRDLNKNIFRGASDDNLNEITGNPIDLLLSLLISNRGDGTKGIYDNLPSGYGLNMSNSKVDIAGFENIRDNFYPTTSATFNFVVNEQQKAIDFFVTEIFLPLNMYPIVKGNGQFSATIYRPTVPPFTPLSITEGDMLEVPSYNGNLTDLINEVQFSYNYGTIASPDDFEDIVLYSDANSINERGVGDRTLEIESTGIKTEFMDADDFLLRSANRIFNRYATPPIKLSVDLMFKFLVVEPGDIILVSNKFLPDLDTGTLAFSDIPMEVVKRTVDWKRGKVKLELLQTGYAKDANAAISPELIVTDVHGTTGFDVDEIKDFEVGFYVSVWRRVLDVDISTVLPQSAQDWYHLEKVADDVEIVGISGNTVTTSSIGVPYELDMRIVYNDNGTPLTTYQQRWGRIDAGYVISA